LNSVVSLFALFIITIKIIGLSPFSSFLTIVCYSLEALFIAFFLFFYDENVFNGSTCIYLDDATSAAVVESLADIDDGCVEPNMIITPWKVHDGIWNAGCIFV
jgi:hypothetical protein